MQPRFPAGGARPPAGGPRPPAAWAAGGAQRPGGPRPPGVKPTVLAAAAAAAQKQPAAAASGVAFKVSTQSTKDEIGIQTLVGDYKEAGTNHGKKVFQKLQKIAGHEDIKVFLYYWDQRDGDDFSGWWFGDQVGGSQVWARCVSHGPTPPRVGWRIPWDSARAEPGLLFVDPMGGAAVTAPVAAGKPAVVPGAAAPAGAMTPADSEGRLQKATDLIASLESSIGQALVTSKTMSATSEVEALEQSHTDLQKSHADILEAQKTLMGDIAAARRGGPATANMVSELSKLSPRLRTLQTQLAPELQRVKGFYTRVAAVAAQKKQQAEAKAANAVAEERDGKEYQEQLPGVQEVAGEAEDSVEAVVALAAPLIAEPPEDSPDLLQQATQEVESAANDAQEKLTAARTTINAKLQQARKFAPETRKAALAEYSGLQIKLTEAQKKLTPYKTFKKDFAARVAARKQLLEMSEKLSAAELEVEKASMMSSAAEHGQMSDEEISAAEKVVQPAKAAIENSIRTIDQRMKSADKAMMDELSQMKDKATGFKKTVDGVFQTLKRQRESLSTRDMLQLAAGKVDAAEDSLKACQEAEMPFLKGIEVLPGEESTKAIADSEAAASKSETAINQARSFLRMKLMEAKRYVKELAASVTEELTAHQTRLEASAKKLNAFKKDTTERKMSALLAEAVDGVQNMEKKVAVVSAAAEIFSSEDLNSVSTDSLKEAMEKTAVAEMEASASMLEVRKVFAAKQREAKGPDAAAAMAKLQGRINDAQAELHKAKKAASTGEKLIRGKEVLLEEDKKITEVEAEVTKSVKKVKPDEEMASLGIEAGKPSDADIEAICTMSAEAQKTLKASSRVVEANLAGAPPVLKALLAKLSERCKASLASISEVMALTKDQRERVMSEAYVRQGKEKVAEVDAAFEKVNEAELPFLKGLEVLPLTEATSATKASEEAAEVVNSTISSARTFIATKNLEVKHFGAAASKPAIQEFAQLTEKINSAASRLAHFKRETELRKKTALIQEAGEKMTATEAEVKTLNEVAEPFAAKADGEKEEKEQSEEATDKLVAQMKAAQAALEDTKRFIAARSKDAQGNQAHTDTLKALNARLAEAQAAVQKHKKVASVYEAKYLAKKVLVDVEERLVAIEAEVKKAAEAAAPLLEEGGERFLVANSARSLAQAWRDHMKAEGLSHEALFAKVSGGAAGGITKEVFLECLSKLPATLGREEIEFEAARSEAIFAFADADADGKLSPEEFKGLFKQRFNCVKEVTITDGFDVTKSKTLGKVAPGELVETMQGEAKDEETGMTRIECTVVSTGQTGFVTMQGNQGTKFMELISPFSIFVSELNETVEKCLKSVSMMSAFFGNKISELNTGTDPVLTKAKAEVLKSKTRVSHASSELQKLKAKIASGRSEYGKKEAKEKNAHIERKDRKEAEALVAPAMAKVEALDAAMAALDEATKTLVSLSKVELEAFLTPQTVAEAADRLGQAVVKAADEAKQALAAQQAEIPKAPSSSMLEAKRDLLKMIGKSEMSKKKCKGVLDAVRAKCGELVESRSAQVAGLMRQDMLSRSLTVETLFSDLAKGDEKISHANFSKHLEGLLGSAYREEHISLLCKHIEVGGIGRRKFQALLQQYFVVVKGIAITDTFEISTAKTLRKAEADEVLEMLEGPRSDEKVGVTRIRAKSLVDGLEGWISLQGNQGTPFLKEVEKPFYSCRADIPLDSQFKRDGSAGPIRTIKAEEIVEVIEGPRKLTYEPGVRVKGKAVSDGALGWFTARDKTGAIFAEADSKYYACTSPVAITDMRDIRDCKVLRKLGIGELFTIEEGPVDEPDAGITRVKGKCIKDEVEGWITIKGNAGTKYAEPSTKHFCVLQEVPLTKLFPSSKSGDEVRKLAKGEAMQVLEGPREETFSPETRVKVKAISDAASGWITVTKDNARPWTPYYKCKVGAPMHRALAEEGAEVVRQVAVGEVLEFLEGPAASGEATRIKARAEKDGEVGYVTIRDAQGKRFFEP